MLNFVRRFIGDYWWILMLVLVLGICSVAVFVDYEKGAGIPQIAGYYAEWDHTLLGSILGVLGQIITFILTIVITAMFLAGQHLSERLPTHVIRPFLWGNSVRVPLFSLFLLLAYDVGLFYFNRPNFHPVAGTAVVALGIVVSAPFALLVVLSTVKALNIDSVIAALDKEAMKAIRNSDVRRLFRALDGLGDTMVFVSERNGMQSTSTALESFLTVADTLTIPVQGHLEVVSGSKGFQVFDRTKRTVLSGPRNAIAGAMIQRHVLLFADLTFLIAKRSPELPEPFRSRYVEDLEDLTKIDATQWDPGFTGALISAIGILATRALEKQDEKLVRHTIAMMERVWRGFFDGADVHRLSLLRLLHRLHHQIGELIEEKKEPKDIAVMHRCRDLLIELHQSYAADVIGSGSSSLYRAWLDVQLSVLDDLILQSDRDRAGNLVDESIALYWLAFYHQRGGAYKTLPRDTWLSLEDSVSDHYDHVMELAFKFEAAASLVIDSGDESSLIPVLDTFQEIYRTAAGKDDIPTIERALRLLGSFTLAPTSVANHIVDFFANSVEDAVERENSPIADILLDSLLTLIRRNSKSGVESSHYALLGSVNDLLTSELLGDAARLRFVEFCGFESAALSAQVRRELFEMLNGFVRGGRSQSILIAGRKVYKQISLAAVEERDTNLVRTVSNYMGWLAYGVIVADFSLAKKVETLSDILVTSSEMYAFSKIFDLGKPVLVYLGTMYAVLGAVCEELTGSEKKELSSLVIDAAVQLGDMQIINEAVYARIHNAIPLPELDSKGDAPYRRFLRRVENGIAKKVASTSLQQ